MSKPSDQIETIVDAALDLPLADRAAYLDQACGGDASLRQSVEALLRAHRHVPASPAATIKISADVASEAPGDRIGPYKLLQQLGEGGCGVVYMAEQEEPVRRRVALKVIKPGMDTKQVIARFEAERQALALMDHPNIAKVLEAGASETGRPYFVMELVRGVKITDYCDQNNLPTQQRLELFIQVCKAVQHAHQKGIIHRDLKPSNILVTLHDGVPVPKVIDFGIAKATEQRLTDKTLFTALHQFIGTPAYMSPEQAEMSGLDIDTRSDIYSLGVLLYELLTSRMPFDPGELVAAGLDAMRKIIRENEPVRPSTKLSTLTAAEQSAVAKQRQVETPKLVQLVRGDLDWIVMKCLEKDRQRRYETANGLAMDIQRHLSNEPVVACPPSAVYRFQKMVRRNKPFAVLGTVILALLLIVAVGSTVAAARLKDLNREGREKLRQAYLSEARALRWSGSEGRRFHALEAIHKAAAIRPGFDLRNEAIAAMALVDLRPEREWPVSDRLMSFDLTYERYAQAGTNGDMVMRRTRDDAELMRLPRTRFPAFEFDFSPNGHLLAVHYRGNGGSNYDFKIYDLKDSWKVILDMPGRWVRMWRFSPDMHLLAVAWKDLNSDDSDRNTVSFFDLTSGQEVNSFTTTPLPWGMSFSPNGSQLALSSTGSLAVQIHSVPDGKVLRTLMHSNGVHHLQWSKGGRLASAGHDGNIYLWDMATLSPSPQLLPHGFVAVAGSFTPGGDMLMSFGWNFLAKLWEVQTGRELLRVSCDGFSGFSSDGRRALVRRRPGTVGISEFAAGEECRSFTFGSKTTGAYVCFSPDGHWMASAHRDGLRLWDLATGHESHYADMGEIVGLQFTRDGSALIAQAENQIMSWPIHSFVENETTRVEVGPPSFWQPNRIEAAHPPNRMLRTVQHKACLFDAASLTVERYLTTPTGVFGGTISPDGRYCATWSRDTGILDIWDAADGSYLVTPNADRSPCASFSPDRRWLIAGSSHEYTVWEIGTWIRKRTIPRGETGGAHGQIAFSKDGTVMAVSVERAAVGLLDTTTFEPLARFEPQEVNTVISLDFNPDGTKLAVGTTANTIHVWDLRLVRQRLAELGLDIPRPPLTPAPPAPGLLELSIVGPRVSVQ